MNIGTVVEGPTDRLLLEAVLNHLLPGEHRFFPLQPAETLGRTGSGWKGVRRWCNETWQREHSSLNKLLSGATGPALDLLVIHVDADIASEQELQQDEAFPIMPQPCPPVSETVAQLEALILHWLRLEASPSSLIFAIPAQDTETWTFAALFPDDELCSQNDYECLYKGKDHPGYRLTLKAYGKLLRRSAGTIKKPRRQYERLCPQIVAAWDDVCALCSQAKKFTVEVLHYEER
jgi:hypothetical protein